MDAREVDLRHAFCSQPQLERILSRDARFVEARCLRDGGPILVPVGCLCQCGKVRPDTHADGRTPPGRRGRGADKVELGDAIEGDARARLYGGRDERSILDRPIDGDPLRRHPAFQSGMELARAEAVAPQAFLAQDPPRREREVRFDRGKNEDGSLRPTLLELAPVAPRVAPELVFGYDMDGRAETTRELNRVAILDEQSALADRQALVEARLHRHRPPPEIDRMPTPDVRCGQMLSGQ